MKYKIMDGNEACSIVSYKFSEMAGIYPITPASPMAEYIDKYASLSQENFFNDVVTVVEMQSEAGARSSSKWYACNNLYRKSRTITYDSKYV